MGGHARYRYQVCIQELDRIFPDVHNISNALLDSEGARLKSVVQVHFQDVKQEFPREADEFHVKMLQSHAFLQDRCIFESDLSALIRSLLATMSNKTRPSLGHAVAQQYHAVSIIECPNVYKIIFSFRNGVPQSTVQHKI